jgi:hypothetical protein
MIRIRITREEREREKVGKSSTTYFDIWKWTLRQYEPGGASWISLSKKSNYNKLDYVLLQLLQLVWLAAVKERMVLLLPC